MINRKMAICYRVIIYLLTGTASEVKIRFNIFVSLEENRFTLS